MNFLKSAQATMIESEAKFFINEKDAAKLAAGIKPMFGTLKLRGLNTLSKEVDGYVTPIVRVNKIMGDVSVQVREHSLEHFFTKPGKGNLNSRNLLNLARKNASYEGHVKWHDIYLEEGNLVYEVTVI